MTADAAPVEPPKKTVADALANLYPEAAEYVVEHWQPGRLEIRSHAIHSSQALCVSLLLTLRQRAPKQRTAIIGAVASTAGLTLPTVAPVDIDAEVREHRQLLCEVGGGTPTALDGLVTSANAVLTIESKFTEPEYGSCGQIKLARVRATDPRFDIADPIKKFRNCTGAHAVGSDLKPTTTALAAACRLTVKDGRRQPRRYWDVAPHLFQPSVLQTPRPCPFASDAYQLMRNLAFAHEWAAKNELPWFGFLVALVDGAPKAKVLRDRVADFKQLLLPTIRDQVGVISYQQMADILDDYGEIALASWIRERLTAVIGASSAADRSDTAELKVRAPESED
jgi:hypothetical protein